MDSLFGPFDHAEAVAMFRAQVIGHLACAQLARGQLKYALEELSTRPLRPPGAQKERTYSFSTLERWYYAYKNGGLDALKPKRRCDRGHARALSDELKELLCEIRKAHPRASVPLIVETLIRQGQLDEDAVSPSTVRRLFRQKGLTRSTGLDVRDEPQRLRWEADAPLTLWHGDVCYGPAIIVDGEEQPVRVHALLDDASRFIVAIEAHHTEREEEMLGLFSDCLRRHPAPDALYLDNGSTYRGDALSAICKRLSIQLIHATPYNPKARGKMERFWRTLKERCLYHTGPLTSLDELNKRLWAFVDEDYHRRPHASLMGRTPKQVWSEDRPDEVNIVDEKRLRDAFTARTERRVRGDSTLSVHGRLFEVDQRFLTGRKVTVCFCVLDEKTPPYVLFDGRRYDLHEVDTKQNARRKRTCTPDNNHVVDGFDPPQTLVDQAVGRTPDKLTTLKKDDQ